MPAPRFGSRTRIVIGAAIVAGAVAVALAAPLIAPFDPLKQDLFSRLVPPVWSAKGEWAHPLGTDNFGRDLLSRLIHGARISMLVGLGAVLVSSTIGTTLGMLAGLREGRAGALIMRFADAHMAFPEVLLAILVVAAVGGSLLNLILILGVSTWMIYARVAFGLTRSLKQRPFVEAAVSQGAGDGYILWRHVLPHILPVLTVVSTLQVAQVMLAETALSFLGLGLPPPAPSWGNVLAEGRDRLLVAPWISNSAGLVIVIVVWGVNMLGSGLRERLDPKGDRR